MNKKYIIGLILIILVLLGIQQYVIRNTPKQEDILFNKIVELESKIDSLSKRKDSIRTVIDSTHIKIIDNEKHFKEVVNTIMVQSTSADSSFISDYIRFHRSQRDSSNIQ